jgi:hypothetical protein
MTSATFSNTTGLAPGIVVRFSLEATGTLSLGSTKLIRNSGATITSADVGRYIGLTDGSAIHLMKISGVLGNEITVAPQGAIASDGNYRFAVYETAAVTSVSGNTVNYNASLPASNVDALQHVPSSAAWNYGDQGLINDVTVRGNTFYVDPAFAHDVFVHKGYTPKGAFEIKNVNRLVYEGNYNLGYPANWAITPRNQNGTAPWTTTSHLILRNNWLAPTENLADSTGRMAVLSLQDELHTTTPATDIQVYNNFAKNVASMLQMKGGDGWTIKHNSVLNDGTATNGYHASVVLEGLPATRFEFRDNLVGYSSYGMSCSMDGKTGTCWPSAIFRNNLVVDFANAGLTGGEWGRGGMLTPLRSRFSEVGFTNLVNDNYRLSASSPYKGKATDGKDPGVDMDELLRALPNGNLPRSFSRLQ